VWRQTLAIHRDPGSLSDPGCLTIVVCDKGTTTTIELHRECDLAGLPSVRQAISRAFEAVPACIVLDLSQLGFIDSTGLHATIELTDRSAAQNTRL
jgi:anti-anti-sigma factor